MCFDKLVFAIKRCLVLTFLSLSFTIAFSQSPGLPVTEANVIPASPSSTAFNKFIETPVGLYTGIPAIDVPLYQIEMHQLSLPISLSYHAGGMKVDEVASWVGAGWALSAGGSINRTVKGLPDEYSLNGKKGLFHNKRFFINGNLDSELLSDCTIPNGTSIQSPNTPYTKGDSVSQGHIDIEPDLYSISYPGGGGKFYFNESRQLVKVSANDDKLLEFPFLQNIPSAFSATDFRWVLLSPDGVRYTFQSSEKTTSVSACGSITPYGGQGISYQNAWYLDSISIGKEWIKFFYETETIQQANRMSTSAKFRIFGSGTQQSTSQCISTTSTLSRRLTRIQTSNGFDIYFDATVNRLDQNGGKVLDAVRITRHGQFVKGWDLSQSYFNSNRKLKLDKVRPVDASLTNYLNGYEFEYEPGNIPPIGSNDQDFWGYYNGAGNSSLIPQYKDQYYHVNRSSLVSRAPLLSTSKIGTIKKIIYPTGGWSEFTYELNNWFDPNAKSHYVHQAVTTVNEGSNTSTFNFNVATNCSATITVDGLANNFSERSELRVWNGTAYVPTTLNSTIGNRLVLPAGSYQLYAATGGANQKSIKIEYEQVQPANVAVGGLRVSKISSFDPVANKFNYKFYQYQIGSQSSGKLFTPAEMGHHFSTHYSGSCGYLVPSQYLNLSDNSKIPLAFYNGSHIGYSVVKEFVLDQSPIGTITDAMKINGETVHMFINDADPTLIEFPFIPQADLSYKNGLKTSESIYQMVNNVLVKRQEHRYFYQTINEPTFVKGANIKTNISRDCYECNVSEFKTSPYEIRTRWTYLDYQEDVMFDEMGNETLKKVTNNHYDVIVPIQHHQLLAQDETDSKNGVVETVFERPALTPALITKHEKFRNQTQIAGNRYTYQGKLLTSYFSWDSGDDSYKIRITNQYDIADNLVLRTDFPDTELPIGVFQSFIWGHNKSMLLAAVQNAKPEEIYYQGFEDCLCASNPVAPILGGKYWNSGTFNFSTNGAFNPATPGNLIMSYWYYANNKWNFSGLVPFQNTISNGQYLDDIRAFPSQAQMQTFNYSPNFLLQTNTDSNGNSNHYYYDSFQRLILTRDDDANILNEYKYQYSNVIGN